MNFELPRPVLEYLLDSTVTASILVLLIGVMQITIGRRLSPGWRFLLWMPVLLRLLVPIFPESSLSLYNLLRWGEGAAEVPVVVQPVEFTPSTETPVMIRVERLTEEERSQWVLHDWSTLLGRAAFLLWVTVAGGLIMRLVVGTAWLQWRFRRDARESAGELKGIMAEAARAVRLGRPPRLRETGLVESPAVFGLFRPWLLLPHGFAERLEPHEIRHVFLHEGAHLKRRDLVVNWLMALAQAIHWFNPLVWLAFRQMRIERELACDAMALRAASGEDPQEYGRTILRLLEGVTARPRLAALVGIAEEKHSAKRRLQQIATFSPGKRRYWIAIPILVALIIAGLTNAQSPTTANISEDRPRDSAVALTLLEQLIVTRIDGLSVSNLNLAEALDALRGQLPAHLQDLKFSWLLRTNVNASPGVSYAPSAASHIVTPIGSKLSPARTVRLAEATPAFKNSSVLQVLDAITRSVEKSLSLEITDDQVIFFEPDATPISGRAARRTLENHDPTPAEIKLQKALQANPEDQEALAHLALLQKIQLTRPNQPRLAIADNTRPPATPTSTSTSGRKGVAGQRRQAIARRLQEIIIPEFYVPGEIPLKMVLAYVSEEAKKHDSEKIGVTLLIREKAPAMDSATGVTKITKPFEQLEEFLVKVDPKLTNVRLSQVLDAIARAARPSGGGPGAGKGTRRIKYSVEDYGVAFSERDVLLTPNASSPERTEAGAMNTGGESTTEENEAGELYTRTYRLNAEAFLNKLEELQGPVPKDDPWEGGKSLDYASGIQSAVRRFLASAGIDFSASPSPLSPAQSEKAIFFNDRAGVLFIRAPLSDMDKVEQALLDLNLPPPASRDVSPPQVTIETRAVEFGTAADFNRFMTRLVRLQKEPRAVLTRAEFDELMEYLEKARGTDILKLPRITTLSGRAARVSVGDIGEPALVLDLHPEYDVLGQTFTLEAASYRENDSENKQSESGVLYNGQTLILGLAGHLLIYEMPMVTHNADGELVFRSTKVPRLYFITPVLIDRAGNLIKNPGDPREEVPPQQ